MRVLLGVLLMGFSLSPVSVSVAVSAAMVVGVIVVSYAELQRRHERNLLHNLGMPVMLTVAICALPAVVAESAIRIAETFGR